MTAQPRKPLLSANLAQQLASHHDQPAPAQHPTTICINVAEGATVHLVVSSAPAVAAPPKQ